MTSTVVQFPIERRFPALASPLRITPKTATHIALTCRMLGLETQLFKPFLLAESERDPQYQGQNFSLDIGEKTRQAFEYIRLENETDDQLILRMFECYVHSQQNPFSAKG